MANPVWINGILLSLMVPVSGVSFGVSMQASPVGENFQPQPPTILAKKLPNYCRSGESLFVSVETKSYWVNICGGDNPGFYVGVDKRNPKNRIRVPLRDYSPQGSYFEAVNGAFTYILAKSARGKVLTVTRGTRELLREYVLSDW